MLSDLLKSIERLEPAAFTIIMATGAFALATGDLSRIFPVMLKPAQILNVLNFILFGLLLVFALCTWPFHDKEFREDLLNPQSAAFYAALAIAFLVLGAQGLRFGLPDWLSVSLWATGCLLTLGVSFAINYHFFTRATPALNLFTPVFFIPVGGLVVIPVAGVNIMNLAAGFLYDLLLMVNSMALGGGLLLYTGLFSLLLHRHYTTESLPHRLAPTVWIHLAPIGWGGVSFVALAEHFGKLESFSRMFAVLLWGACCWWLIMCLILTCRAAFSGQMKFSLAYWAFIFPLGAIAILSFRLGQSWWAAFYFAWGLMAGVWLIAAWNTLKSFAVWLTRACRRS
ncbi:MAG: hypothetical protein K2H64_12605 [Desulfovibrio sp.]|nr:hypothetical protein [Desulfovibrio sp.]